MSLSPNMNLSIPSVGVTDGPEWASELNASLNLIDAHDHTTGNGVPITPSAININANLSFNSYNILAINYAGFTAQSAPLTGTDFVYISGVDLYFNDGNGNQVRITQSGGVAGSPGSISNLTAPASASYVAADSTFVWESDSNKAANMDCGSVILRNLTTSSFGITLSPPTLAANYTITLPALPAATKFMSMDNTGAIGAAWAVDNSTIEVNANTVQVKASGIGPTQIASSAVTTAKIAALAVTTPKLAALNYTLDSSTGSTSVTNTTSTVASITLTPTSRPVKIEVLGNGDSAFSYFGATCTTGPAIVEAFIQRNGSTIARFRLRSESTNTLIQIPSSSISTIDFAPTFSSSNTYTLSLTAPADTTAFLFNGRLIVYEIG